MGLREELLAQGCVEHKTQKSVIFYKNKDDEIIAKYCSKCDALKLLTEFARRKDRIGGVDPTCKQCRRSFYAQNKDKYSKRKAEYRQENIEKVRERDKKWREGNKEKRASYAREWYLENRETCIKRSRKYYYKNKEKCAEQRRLWARNNRAKKF